MCLPSWKFGLPDLFHQIKFPTWQTVMMRISELIVMKILVAFFTVYFLTSHGLLAQMQQIRITSQGNVVSSGPILVRPGQNVQLSLPQSFSGLQGSLVTTQPAPQIVENNVSSRINDAEGTVETEFTVKKDAPEGDIPVTVTSEIGESKVLNNVLVIVHDPPPATGGDGESGHPPHKPEKEGTSISNADHNSDCPTQWWSIIITLIIGVVVGRFSKAK